MATASRVPLGRDHGRIRRRGRKPDAGIRNMVAGGSGMHTSEDAGGSGGESIQPQPTTRDVRLLERAIAEGWHVPDALRGPLIERLGRIALDPSSRPREAISAGKALMLASRINLDSISVA